MKNSLPLKLKEKLEEGLFIPAHPTALTKELKLDEKRQRALSRYYLDAGVGGLAIGVHTSQFEIRNANLYKPILELGKEEIDLFTERTNKSVLRISGIIGKAEDALKEARISSDLGYNASLLSLGSFKNESNKAMIEHCKAIAEVTPIIGFYLQPAVGGRILDTNFWREFSEIKNVVAIKLAPFCRYKTIDAIRGVIESNRADEIALYTGNDDNIIADLLTEYEMPNDSEIVNKRIVGGLLGHWSIWTKTSVNHFDRIKKVKPEDIPELLKLGVKITDSNAAIYDARNKFKGSIAGVHEILRRQGLFESINMLNPNEVLSVGQSEEIDRIYKLYPELNDDHFVKQNLDRWLS